MPSYILSEPYKQRVDHALSVVEGQPSQGNVTTIQIPPSGSPAANPAFDVTPARLVTGLITERGICPATETGLRNLFPEHA